MNKDDVTFIAVVAIVIIIHALAQHINTNDTIRKEIQKAKVEILEKMG